MVLTPHTTQHDAERKQDVGRIRFETYLITFKQRSPLHFNILIQQSIYAYSWKHYWWIFGGLEAAIGYFTGSLALAITIIGIPAAVQTFKLGLLCLWPFGAEVRDGESLSGCITIPLNIIWIIFGGFMGMSYPHLLWTTSCHHDYRYSFCKATLQNGWTIPYTFWQRC